MAEVILHPHHQNALREKSRCAETRIRENKTAMIQSIDCIIDDLHRIEAATGYAFIAIFIDAFRKQQDLVRTVGVNPESKLLCETISLRVTAINNVLRLEMERLGYPATNQSQVTRNNMADRT